MTKNDHFHPYGTDDLARDLLIARNQLAAAQTQNEQARSDLELLLALLNRLAAGWEFLAGSAELLEAGTMQLEHGRRTDLEQLAACAEELRAVMSVAAASAGRDEERGEE